MLDKIGQLIITGFDSPTPSDEFLEFCASENIGGVILFEENCNPHALAEETIRRIYGACGIIPFVAVDQEGGRVCRFRGAPAEYGAPSEYGRKGKLDRFDEDYRRAALYLHSMGINLLLGPVADLDLSGNNSCLEGRTFGSNPARVIPFIEKAVRANGRLGLLSCLKHFPGYGAAASDPHEVLAVAEYDYQTFINREALTFKAGVGFGADMVMTTHLLLPAIDDNPATFSSKIIKDLLRQVLDFDGLVVTDDLLMKGAALFGDHGERALKAFLAGHDLLLFGRDFRAARQALLYLKESYRTGLIEPKRLETSLDRISGVKSKLSVAVH